jgi:hypothetical protein
MSSQPNMSAHNIAWAGRAADAPVTPRPEPLFSPSADAAMVEFALDYAKRGIPVFPCRASNKAPLVEGGFHSATTDTETIRRWWTEFPRAMIGVPTGPRSGFWGIDPDPPKKEEEPDGRAVWAEILQKHDPLPATHTEITPRGGTHVLFSWDPDRPVTNSPGAFTGQNIDVRGDGGYLIMHPSVCTGDGSTKNVVGQYSVADPLNIFQFAKAPDWLYELVLQPEPEKPSAPVLPTPERTSSLLPKESNPFWHNVNALAMDRLSSWVPDAFPKAHFEKNTGAWRVTSCDLGRNLEEDLSISPEGIVDWGVWDIGDQRNGKRTPISLLIEHGVGREAVEAAHWICSRCGVDPASLGWRNGAKPQNAARAVLAEAEEIDNGTITQDGIARVFARRFEDQLRFCHHAGAWYEWAGAQWKKDETSLAFQFCRELGREFTEDAKSTELKEVRKYSFAGGVERFARSDRLLAVTSEAWDRDPFLLGTPGGTVDLRTGKLHEPDPVDGITKLTAVAPADAVECPRWLQFLDEVGRILPDRRYSRACACVRLRQRQER